MLMGDYELAFASFEEALALGALQGSSRDLVSALFAGALCHRGDDARAVALLDKALPILRAEAGAVFVCTALLWRAQIARESEDDTNAESLLRESLRLRKVRSGP